MGTVRKWTFESRELWLTARVGFIGGSDAACVLGLNPWKSNVELWEEKTGRRQREDIGDKPYVLYGTKAEEHLRELFKLDFPQYEVGYEDHNMWINPDFPFAHASLDGWLTEKETGRKGILEIKTTNILQSMQREKWNHRIPDNYYVQVCHYLMVTEADFAVLKAQLRYDYDGDIYLTTKHYFIDREEVKEDISFLETKEREFARCIQMDERPPLVLPEI